MGIMAPRPTLKIHVCCLFRSAFYLIRNWFLMRSQNLKAEQALSEVVTILTSNKEAKVRIFTLV